jgi:hypothetical protein
MAIWECAECTARYAVGLPECPQCGSTVRVNEKTQPESEEEQDMPKVTVHGGPSIEGFEVNPATGELTPSDEGGEDVSAGSNSSTSSEKDSSSQPTSEQPAPSPAPTTASRSAKARTGKGSTARPTDGGPADGTSATGSADA